MDKCTGVRCQMQHGYKADECPMHIKGKAADDTLLTAVDDDFCSYGEVK